MRLTMQSIHNDILKNLNKITTDMARLNSQISSGKQMSKISDDPVNLVTALGLRTNLTQITSYQSNLNFGNSMITASESALNSMKEMAIRGKELAIQMANGTMTQENRTSAAMEVSHLWEEAIFLANSQVAGKYVFGGYRTAGYSEAEPAPFIADMVDGYIVNGQSMTIDTTVDPLTKYDLNSGDLSINGIPIDTVPDPLNPATTAAEKMAAINAKSTETGVTADFTAASVTATGPVAAGTMNPGDLWINGVDIFAGATVISLGDDDNVLVNAINAKTTGTPGTGVIASRDSSGALTLTAIDGRNIQVTTTDNGEDISQLNNDTGTAANTVYFGTVQLKSDLPITLQADPTAGEQGLVALGLDGGSAVTNEANDVAGDGLLMITTIQQQTGNVRYAGDRDNNIAVKVGATSSLEVTKNGMDAIMSTGVFSALKGLENALRAEKYTTVTGPNEATARGNTMASGNTGLEQDGLAFAPGTLSFTVTDQSYYPPRAKTINLELAATETPESIANRISEIPGLKASWSTDNHLTVESSDPDRYTFNYTDSSNFMAMNGITQDELQFQAIQKSIGELGTLLDNLSNQVSDFGARANRIEVQSSLYMNLELAAKENLSGKEDTDMLKAIMELNGKKTAYEAALSAAAQTMQLSLVDYI
ncbi:MAG: flagellin N-terminal helical domain-containing protein [Desulfobulbia bacterium]